MKSEAKERSDTVVSKIEYRSDRGRGVGVIDTRFKCLICLAAKEMGVALKYQSGVEREGRHHEARRLVGVLVVAAEIVELIPGPLNLGLRHNEPPRASQRIACTLLKHYTCAVKTCGMRETSGVNGRRELEAVEVAVIGIQNHLRHTFVGNNRCAAVNLQRLILSNAQQRIQ